MCHYLFNYLDVNESALEDSFCALAPFSMTLSVGTQSTPLHGHLTCKCTNFQFPDNYNLHNLKGVRFSFGIVPHHSLPSSRENKYAPSLFFP